MNYYLLSVTNDFASDGLCKEIAISLSPIVDSPNLKFHYTRNQIIFSFGTETEKSEIYEYITGILYGLVEIFVLTEVVDDYSVSLPITSSNFSAGTSAFTSSTGSNALSFS